MSVPVLTFFNCKSSVCKTHLAYHVAWMLSLYGRRVLLVDADPQANLTARMLDDDALGQLWRGESAVTGLFQGLRPVLAGGEQETPVPQPIAEGLHMLPGQMGLMSLETPLQESWWMCGHETDRKAMTQAMRLLTSVWRVLQRSAACVDAELIVVDAAPSLGALNGAVLVGSDYLALPFASDLFSLEAMEVMGDALRQWRTGWRERVDRCSGLGVEAEELTLPAGSMRPIGYLCQRPGVRMERTLVVCDEWMRQFPGAYRRHVLQQEPGSLDWPGDDPECLAILKHFRGLVPMAEEVRKPIFLLKVADGATGCFAEATHEAWRDYRTLTERIAARVGLPIPPGTLPRW